MAVEETERRTQAQRRSESEESLLDAAAESIAQRGIERTSLALIGERAGKSRGLANHHFGSKSTLVARLAERCQDRLQAVSAAAVERGMSNEEGPNALEAIRVVVDTYLQRFENPTPDERALIVMWGATFATHSSVDKMVEADRRAYDGLAEVMARGQEAGSVSTDVDPQAAAVILLALMRGIAAQELTETSVIDIRRVRAACRDWITASLSPPASHPKARAGRRASTSA